MKDNKEKPANGQYLAELQYVLLDVKERILDGSFFELSSQAQSLLHVLAANVYSTDTGKCLYQRELMYHQAGIRRDSMGGALDEIIEAGLAVKDEWGHKKKTLILPIKKTGMHNNTERYVYLDSRVVTIFLWASFPTNTRSVYWLLKGHAVPGCKADYGFIDDREKYNELVKTTRFEIVPENVLDRFGVTSERGHTMIKKSRNIYNKGLAELRKSKIVYDYSGKYMKGLAIKKINML